MEQNTVSLTRLEMLSSAKLVLQENEPSKVYFGKCKFNYFGKLKTLSNGKEIFGGETAFSYVRKIMAMIFLFKHDQLVRNYLTIFALFTEH